MGKISFFTGIGLLVVSGILFTLERAIAVLHYGIDISNERSTSYPGEPSMPGVFDNFFVGFILILGIALLILGGFKVFTNAK